jgi:TetR/AcrR family transcriptional repressor of nem operon
MSGEPRTARGRATRERILAAATELIARRGVAATSLEDVRRAAGASKSQLYLYFADREDLLRAVAHATTDQVMAGQSEALSGCDSLAGIQHYFDGVVAKQHERRARGGCPLGTLAGQLAETDEGARRELAAGMERWDTALRAGLTAMAQRGELSPDVDPETLATQTLALIQGGLLLTQIHRSPAQVRVALDGALALISAALAAPDGAKLAQRV